MSKKPSFRRPFNKQHVKCAKALSKSGSQHLYHIHWSLPSQLSWKKSLLLTCQILGLLVNTLAADEKYPVLNRDNLTIPIQMQLSLTQNTFFYFWLQFWNVDWILNILKQKMTLRDFVFPNLRTRKTKSDKFLKSVVWEDPSRSNMENVPKDCRSLCHSTFITFIDHCPVNWVGKSSS